MKVDNEFPSFCVTRSPVFLLKWAWFIGVYTEQADPGREHVGEWRWHN